MNDVVANGRVQSVARALPASAVQGRRLELGLHQGHLARAGGGPRRAGRSPRAASAGHDHEQAGDEVLGRAGPATWVGTAPIACEGPADAAWPSSRGSPNRSAALPISQGDQMSPRKWIAKIEMAYAAARRLGCTTLAMIALHGPGVDEHQRLGGEDRGEDHRARRSRTAPPERTGSRRASPRPARGRAPGAWSSPAGRRASRRCAIPTTAATKRDRPRIDVGPVLVEARGC